MSTTRSAKQEASMAKAQEAYARETAKAYEAIRKIKEQLAADATSGEEKHWGHVGSAEHAANLLTEIAGFLSGDENWDA